MQTEVIRKITIRSTTEGAAESAAALDKLKTSHEGVAKAVEASDRRFNSSLRTQQDFEKAQRQVSAAVSSNGVADFAKSTLELAGHLKLAAAAAYIFIPAFRQMVNPAIIAGVAQIPGAIHAISPAAFSAGVAVTRGLMPGLTFLARSSGLILVAAGAVQVLASTWKTGSDLIEKYAKQQRELFGADAEEATLKKLTRLQQDTIDAAQVQTATNLGIRLDEANRKIAEFWKVQIDTTNVALGLQSVWVRIVELIGSAAEKATQVGRNAVPGGGSFIGRVLNVLTRGGWSGTSEAAPAQDPAEALQAARGRLSAAMGGDSFWKRWNDNIRALGEGTKKTTDDTEKLTNAWTRAVNTTSRNIAIQEAQAAAVGQGAGQLARLRTEAELTEAAQRAGIPITGQAAEQYRILGERAAAAGEALARARVTSEARFDRSTMFLGEGEADIARTLRPVYGDNVSTSLSSAEAGVLRVNAALKETRDLTKEFATGFARDFRSELQNGANAWDAFGKAGINALNRLTDKLSDMVINGLVNKALGGLAGGGLGNLFSFGSFAGSGFGGSGAPLAVGSGRIGGMVGSLPQMQYVHPAYYESAPRMRGGGFITDDGVPVVAHPGERILNAAETRAYNARSGGVVVNHTIINNAGVDVQTSERQNSDGSIDIETAIERKVNKTIGSGAADRSLRRVGGAPTVTRR